MKFYKLEIEQIVGYSCKYRFVSLFNGARGTWNYTKENAIKEGEDHKKLICVAYKIEDKSE